MLLNNFFSWLERKYRSITYVVCALSIQMTLVAFLGFLYWPSILQENSVSFMSSMRLEKPLVVKHRRQIS